MIDPFGFGRWRVLLHAKRAKARRRHRRDEGGASPARSSAQPVTARDIVQPMAVRLLKPRPVGTCLASFDRLAGSGRQSVPSGGDSFAMPAIPPGVVPTVCIGMGPNKSFMDVRAADPALDRWDRMPLAFALALLGGAHAQV